MKIISLTDDIKLDNNLISEHGLSFYIEHGSKKYLFDTGASDAFISNAERLGIDISDIDALFISHNHYDHIGGLLYFIRINRKAKIYIKEDAVYETFYEHNNIKCFVGQHHKEILKSNRITFVKDSMKVDNIFLVSDTNCNEKYFCQGKRFYMVKDNKIIPDVFSHEMFLVYIRDEKANIFSACSHRGIINIIETTKNTFHLPINILAAGFHLSANGGKAINCTPEYYNFLADYLKNEDINKIYTCHCTGKYAYEKLKQNLKEKIDYFYISNTIEI